jgi:hypothetical protein
VRSLYHCEVVTQKAWHVPVILGRFPKTPTDESSAEAKGQFALFILLLFKPWRNLRKDLLACASDHGLAKSDNPWDDLYVYYQKWFAELQALNAAVRAQYAAQCDTHQDLNLLEESGSISWQTPQYWAVRVVPIIETMQRSFARQQDTTGAAPSFFLPPHTENAEVEDSDEVTSSEISSHDGDGIAGNDEPDGEEPVRGIAKPAHNPCGELPSDFEVLKKSIDLCKTFQRTWQRGFVLQASTNVLDAECSALLACGKFPAWSNKISFRCGCSCRS